MSLETTQTGGDHYKGMGIQPIEFAHANDWDPCAFSVLKYVSRHRRKNGAEDMQKALDFVGFRVELMDKHGFRAVVGRMSMFEYLRANRIEDLQDVLILGSLDKWVGGRVNDHDALVTSLKTLIRDQIALYHQKGTK